LVEFIRMWHEGHNLLSTIIDFLEFVPTTWATF